jgi:hypothetical protein
MPMPQKAMCKKEQVQKRKMWRNMHVPAAAARPFAATGGVQGRRAEAFGASHLGDEASAP